MSSLCSSFPTRPESLLRPTSTRRTLRPHSIGSPVQLLMADYALPAPRPRHSRLRPRSFISGVSDRHRSRSVCSGLAAAHHGLLLLPPGFFRSSDSGFQSPGMSPHSDFRRRPFVRSSSFHNLHDSLSGYTNRYPGLSGSDKATNSSRASSIGSLDSSEHDIDYKMLYEKERQESERLRKKVEELEEQNALVEKKVADNNMMMNGSATELSERDRRAFQRRVAELEEDLKELDKLRADNHRLKEENGALIRVISKLSK